MTAGTENNNTYIMPGEFEPQTAVWLGWPTFQWFSEPELDTRQTIASIASVVAEREITVNIMCGDSSGIAQAQKWLKDNGFKSLPSIHFLAIDQVDIWMRDYGPIFLVDKTDGKLAMASFAQNQWGYSTRTDPVSVRMTKLPEAVAKYLGIDTMRTTNVVSEGGDRIQNGQGTLLVGRAVEFQRNPGYTKEEMESAYEYALGVSNVIWLDAGVREDLHTDWGPIPYADSSGGQVLLYGAQSTGGHLDEFCRFASATTILLSEVAIQDAASDPIAAVNYARLADAYRVLSRAVDQDGKPFEILRIPTPATEYRSVDPDQPMYKNFLATLDYSHDAPSFPKGQPVNIVRSSSYANFLITNGLIVAPKYGDSQRDAEAQSALSKAYPGREIVQIDPTPLNYAGGGIHCVTQQQPKPNA